MEMEIENNISQDNSTSASTTELQPYVEVRVNINDSVIQMPVINLATSKKEYIAVTKEIKIRLSQGRGYYIPVNTMIDSDNYWNTKVFSDIAHNLTVCFVKNGYAYIIPHQHNVLLENNNLICLYWNHVQNS